MQVGTPGKKANCALAEKEIKAPADCEVKELEQSAEEKEVVGRNEEARENPTDSPNIKWPEPLNLCPETAKERNLQAGDEREANHRDSLGQTDRTDGRLVEGSLQIHLSRADQPLKGDLTEGAKTFLGVLQKHSTLQDLESEHIRKAEWSVGPAFTQGQECVQVCPQELVSGSQSPESKRQIQSGFKKVNDKIVKITCSSPEAMQQRNSSSVLQQEADHTGRSLDLSDGDYASDEPSGTEKMSVKKYSRSSPGKQDIQAPSRQPSLSLSTNSSDSSTGAVRMKGSRAHASLQQSEFHLTKSKRREYEPESKNENRARDVKSLDLLSSAVAGQIPAFEIKATPVVEQPQNKLFTDMLDIFTEETHNIPTRGLERGVYHGGIPSLARVEEEQDKAVHFLRTPMDKLKTVRSQELPHPLEYSREGIHTLRKEKVMHSKFKGKARVTGESVKSEEIQILKQQIAGLQEEFRRNESCWHAAYGKLRDQVEMLTRQNMELQDELRVSEHQRLKAEKKTGAVKPMDTKSETLVAEAILRETAPSSNQEERSRRDKHTSHITFHTGPKAALQKRFVRDTNSKV
ncbi:CENPJ protein, partial [Alectura lathami]|nr:CENPJ protein [Alectura lathami]